jgi:cytochrome P450
VLRSAREGLFLSRDGVWSMLRKVWQPTFHSESLAGYAPRMASEAARLVDHLSEVAAGGAPTNIWRDIGNMTMSVVGSAAYGVDFALLSKAPAAGPHRGQELVRAAAEMFHSSEISNATRYLAAGHLMPVLVPAISLLAAWFPDERYSRLVRVRPFARSGRRGASRG